MTTLGNAPPLSPQAFDEIRSSASRIAGLVCAERLWARHLTPQERARLGGDVQTAYEQLGTAGMWAKLRPVTPYRAVVDVAGKLGFLRTEDAEWLLGEIGESLDAEQAIAIAVTQDDLVMAERPRAAYWNGAPINIDWHQLSASWEFFWELVRHAKVGQPIDRFTFGENMHLDFVAKRKSRLTTMSEFPVDLSDFINSVGRRTQQLNIPRERIRIFELDGLETLREWVP